MKAGDILDFINGETISIILFFIGIYGLIARRNVIKSIVSVGVMQVACILFFLSINFTDEALPPLKDSADHVVSDPLPQALMITAIVIGISVTAVALTMFITLYHKYGSTNWLKINKKRINTEDD